MYKVDLNSDLGAVSYTHLPTELLLALCRFPLMESRSFFSLTDRQPEDMERSLQWHL